MAQIGEFAFIVATLGLSLKVTSSFLFPVAVGASAITTFTTPYLIKSSGAVYQWLQKVLPEGLLNRLNRYSVETKTVAHTSEWKLFIRSTIMNIVLVSIIVVGIILFSSVYVEPWVNRNGNSFGLKLAVCMLTLFILSPFLWALAVRTPSEVYRRMIDSYQYRKSFYIGRFFRLALVAFFVGFLLHRFFTVSVGIVFTVLILASLVIFSKQIQEFYQKLERRFMANLNERETEVSRINRTELAPWDAHIVPVTVPPTAACIGKTLMDVKWRETIGVNVVMIKRGDLHIAAPDKDQVIYPLDELLVLGTDLQIQKLKVMIKPDEKEGQNEIEDVELHHYFIGDENGLIGKTIRETGLREKAKALVVGLERKDERILNPESDTRLERGDHLFIVANRKQIRNLLPQFEKRG